MSDPADHDGSCRLDIVIETLQREGTQINEVPRYMDRRDIALADAFNRTESKSFDQDNAMIRHCAALD